MTWTNNHDVIIVRPDRTHRNLGARETPPPHPDAPRVVRPHAGVGEQRQHLPPSHPAHRPSRARAQLIQNADPAEDGFEQGSARATRAGLTTVVRRGDPHHPTPPSGAAGGAEEEEEGDDRRTASLCAAAPSTSPASSASSAI